MTPRKLVGKLHLWLGLSSGLIVFILAVTGCLYVFVDEIKPLVYADRLFVEPRAADPLPLGALWSAAQKELGDEYPIQRMRVENAPDRSYRFSSFKDNPDAFTYFGSVAHFHTVYVNPYDGKILKVENTENEFFRIVLWLHWSLLLNTRFGQPIVGTAVLIFVFLLLTGLVLWWPRNRTALKARLSIAWKSKFRRLNWDLHSVPGIYSLLIALLIALTGLVWAFKWFNNAVYFTATGGKTLVREAPLASDTSKSTAGSPLDAIFAEVRKLAPDAREYSVSIPEKKEGVISGFARFGHHVHYRTLRLQFDRYSGALLRSKSFEAMDRGEKLQALNYDLHVGAILGLPGKILAFLASLVCATLPVTGLLVWLGKRRKPSRSSGGNPAGGARGPIRRSEQSKEPHSISNRSGSRMEKR